MYSYANPTLPSNPRRRGVHLTPLGLKKLRNAIDELEFEENYGEKYTLKDLSYRVKLDAVTVSKVLEARLGVDKRTLERCFRSLNLELDSSDYTKPLLKDERSQIPVAAVAPYAHPQQDLREGVEVSVFYGRTHELAELEQWVVGDAPEQRLCQRRLVAVVGMGGVGKTALVAKLVEQVSSQFEIVIWKSLRNAPPLKDLLTAGVQFLSAQPEMQLSDSIGISISQLRAYLSQHRCLLVLDNAESIMQGGVLAGNYREGYEDYGELLHQVAETRHQSCVILTSREQPKVVQRFAGAIAPVQTLHLQGLSEAAARELMQARGVVSGSDSDWQVVIGHYCGNPLALQIVASAIQAYLHGDLREFVRHLQQGQFRFRDICTLLEQQFERLTQLEQQVMTWLAIHREWASVQELQDQIVPAVALWELLEVLDSLQQRSLIHKRDCQFTLKPVVMEYVTGSLIERVCQEIATEQLQWFNDYALVQASANNDLRAAQNRLILKPVLDGLLKVFRSKDNLKAQLLQILAKLQEQTSQKSGYATENILNLRYQIES